MLSKLSLFFRENGTFTVVDVDIVTLALGGFFDATALESSLRVALNAAVDDARFGDYDVHTSGSVDVGPTVLGIFQTFIEKL